MIVPVGLAHQEEQSVARGIRAWTVEPTFGAIKLVRGFRQFLADCEVHLLARFPKLPGAMTRRGISEK